MPMMRRAASMTEAIGRAFETKSAAPAARARSRASRVSMLESTITRAPAARQVRTRASIETGSFSWKSMNTRSVGNAGLCTSCSQVARHQHDLEVGGVAADPAAEAVEQHLVIVEDREPHALGRGTRRRRRRPGERWGFARAHAHSLMNSGPARASAPRIAACSEERRLDAGGRMGRELGGDQAGTRRVGAELRAPRRSPSRASHRASRRRAGRRSPDRGAAGARDRTCAAAGGRASASHARYSLVGVAARAVHLAIARNEFGVLAFEPGPVPLARTRPQVQGAVRDRVGPGIPDRGERGARGARSSR